MKIHRIPTLAALIGACFFTVACDRRDNIVAPPMPQATPGDMPSTTPGGAMPGGAASAPGMGASR